MFDKDIPTGFEYKDFLLLQGLLMHDFDRLDHELFLDARRNLSPVSFFVLIIG